MKPYYERAGISIYHGDCRAVLPQLSGVDLLWTDPAYEIISGGNTSGRMMGGMFDPSVYDNSGELFPTVPYAEWLPLAYQALAQNADTYIMANDKNLEDCLAAARNAGLGLHNVLCWLKNTKTPNRWGMKSVEFIAYGWKGHARTLNDCGMGQTFHDANPKDKRHPTEKPVTLILPMLTNSTDPGGLVLDPFMGCGSTLIAAKLSGRRAIGIELTESYCEAAAAWLDATWPLDAHEQVPLFNFEEAA